MTADQHLDRNEESPDSPDLVLAALHSRHLVGNQIEIDKLQLAVQWAICHPVESIDHGAATVDGTEAELAIAGPGAPLVAEFCVADLALALGMSTDAGRGYLGDAVEIRYRLPKIWAAVTTGRVPVWKARRIARATKSLSVDGAGFVDRHLAHRAARCSFAQIDRAVEEALRLFDPAQAEKRRREAADERCFDVDLDQASFNGTVHVDGELDIADALDLTVPERKRELMIYLHLGGGESADVENTRSTVSVDQVKDWCAGSNTQVTVRPVIDLNGNLSAHGYQPTEAMREQAILTNTTCVFPRCTRPARSADLDHVESWDGTNTESVNLAPLCRGHHRYKTHGGWEVVRTGPTSFTWTTPYGCSYDWDTRHTRHLC